MPRSSWRFATAPLAQDTTSRLSRESQLGFQADNLAERIRSGEHWRSRRRSGLLQYDQAAHEPLPSNVPASEVHSSGDTGALLQRCYTVQELAAVIYDKFQEEELPNFIPHVRLNQDGGLERLEEIWNPQKYIWCILITASVSFNLAWLIIMNWAIFKSIIFNTVHQDQAIFSSFFSGNVAEGLRSVRNVTEGFPNSGVESMHAFRKSAEMADMFKHIEDADTRAKVLTVAGAVASFEVIYILWYMVHVVNRLVVFAFGTSEFGSYDAVMELVRLQIPQMSTFSALKLIGRVHPALVYNEFLHFYSHTRFGYTPLGQKSRFAFVAVLIWFVLSRLFLALTAVAAFAVKVLAVGFRFINPHISWTARFAPVIALLNNCMGIVLFERLLQDRLFLFVFGGQDTEYQDQERALLHVYQCRIAKKIWTSCWLRGERLKAVVLLVTLDHYDLQRLLIDDLNNTASPKSGGGSPSSRIDIGSPTPTLLTSRRVHPELCKNLTLP